MGLLHFWSRGCCIHQQSHKSGNESWVMTCYLGSMPQRFEKYDRPSWLIQRLMEVVSWKKWWGAHLSILVSFGSQHWHDTWVIRPECCTPSFSLYLQRLSFVLVGSKVFALSYLVPLMAICCVSRSALAAPLWFNGLVTGWRNFGGKPLVRQELQMIRMKRKNIKSIVLSWTRFIDRCRYRNPLLLVCLLFLSLEALHDILFLGLTKFLRRREDNSSALSLNLQTSFFLCPKVFARWLLGLGWVLWLRVQVSMVAEHVNILKKQSLKMC